MAFHPYPHLIRGVFNLLRFGPPLGLTPASPWTWIDHPVSGLLHATLSPYSDSLSLRLRLCRLNLAASSNSLTHYAKGTRSPLAPKGHWAPTDCRHMVSELFTPLYGVLFTFPSRYLSTIGDRVVFSLGRWSFQIPTGFHVPCGTWEHHRKRFGFRLQGCHLLWLTFPDHSANQTFCNFLERLRSLWQVPQHRPYIARKL